MNRVMRINREFIDAISNYVSDMKQCNDKVTVNIPEVFTFFPSYCKQIETTLDSLLFISGYNTASYRMEIIHIFTIDYNLNIIEDKINDILYSDRIWGSKDAKILEAVHDLKRMIYLTELFRNYCYCNSKKGGNKE